jgi:hypothetical protein
MRRRLMNSGHEFIHCQQCIHVGHPHNVPAEFAPGLGT